MMAIKEKPEPREKPWSYPEPGTPRGGLSPLEEVAIHDTPRPAKLQDQLDEEAADRLLKADRRPITAEDRRPIPLQLHKSREVALDGTPEMAEAMVMYINDESHRTLREREWFTVLEEVQRTNRPLWTLLEEHFFFKQSISTIAAQMHLSESKLRLIMATALLDLQARLVELFGTQP